MNNACIIIKNHVFYLLLNNAKLYLIISPYSKNIKISPQLLKMLIIR